MKYLNVFQVKKLVKDNGKRTGKDFLVQLDKFIESKVLEATKVHNGSKVTIDAEIAGVVGIK